MREFFDWFTHMENTKPLSLVLLFVTFVGIVLYVYSNRKRSKRLENYKYIPLDDDVTSTKEQPTGEHHEH
jgi:cbb3-type cytochrome oxidase subunit 3